MEWPEGVSGKAYVEYREKVLHPEGDWALEQASQGSDHSTNLHRVQQVFGQCSQVHGVVLGDRSMQAQDLDSVIPVSSFQLSISCDSVNH